MAIYDIRPSTKGLGGYKMKRLVIEEQFKRVPDLRIQTCHVCGKLMHQNIEAGTEKCLNHVCMVRDLVFNIRVKHVKI